MIRTVCHYFIAIILLIPISNIQAQVIQDSKQSNRSITTTDSVSNDSLYLKKMAEALREAQITEANMRMEIEQLRLKTIVADSLKQAAQLRRIDSLRHFTKGIPVIVDKDTLFTLFAKRGGHSPSNRASSIAEIVNRLGKQFSVQPDSIYLESTDISTELMYKNEVIASVTDQDALWENLNREQLAQKWRTAIVQELYKLQKEHGLIQFIKRGTLFALVIIVQVFLFWGTNRLLRKIRSKISELQQTHMKPIMIQNYELFDTKRQVQLFLFLANIGRYVLMLLQLLISVPILFSIFPQTKDIALTLFSYLWNPTKDILKNILNYIPNLFTIIVIYFAIKYVTKGIKYLSSEVEHERLKIPGFYPDWAAPTFHIIRFLLYAFMIAMIYPYLPGSNSDIFKGVSVFVGIIISLGSSSAIGNIVSGLIITYMRPFRQGDYVELNNTIGIVIEKTPLVTRLRTPKNEIITIPNSSVMSSPTINYSESAREKGLILHTEVSIGYDIPWQDVHAAMITGAKRTPNVLQDPEPFVLQLRIEDWYPVYQINVYITNVNIKPRIQSDLNQNVMDALHEANIEILSPHYIAVRDGNPSTIPSAKKKE